MKSEVATVMSFDDVRYSCVWEDHRLLDSALNVNCSDTVLSICSAGCNVLHLLLSGPAKVVAIDLSPAQLSLLELKLIGIGHLEHEDFLCLLGYRTSTQRCATDLYSTLRPHLSDRARSFFDSRDTLFHEGLFRCGRLERYFHGFQTHPTVVAARPAIERLLRSSSLAEQQRAFEELSSPAFTDLFRFYFGREMMAKNGRDPAQFSHVAHGDVGGYFEGRFRHACMGMPVADNFYLRQFLLGHPLELEDAQPYLRRSSFHKLKALAGRVELVQEELESYLSRQPDGALSKANLSDVFEYMSEGLSDAVFGELSRCLRAGGRLAYWNLLTDRQRPAQLRGELAPQKALALSLWKADRAWFYKAFHIDERLP
ncbi:MAG: BtaA family protein [Myxococcota bacterium]|jgi:S-adenosylmethionine-diacylglycerol 3-amino-3-carboxypropyl transferase|nr:BtaA family protein [Myxococcota bacterium]